MALTITGLSKTYPNGVKALKNLSLTIGNNMFGLLGPNGAGKSTLMRTVATLQDPDSGSITLDGLDVLTQKNEVRKILGYLPQEFGVYPKMSAVDMLDHLAVLKGITAAGERKEMVDALLQQTNLWDVAQEGPQHLLGRHEAALRHRAGSAGQSAADHRRRAHRRPRPRRAQPLSQSAQLDRPRVTVILSTHIVDDVRELCSRMAIIASGEVLLEGAPTEALDRAQGTNLEQSRRHATTNCAPSNPQFR